MAQQVPLSGYQPGSPRERAVSAALALAIIVIALLLALLKTVVAPPPNPQSALVSFDVRPEGAAAAKARPSPRHEHARVKPQPRRTGTPPPRIAVAKPAAEPAAPKADDGGFIHMSSDDLASADIGKMHGSGTGAGKQAYGPGEGPGGLRLVSADWYRLPTDAQLGGYLKPTMPSEGWGEIACQTIEHYHVDNCRILGESPLGSGFGRAVQNAAWQFLVIPPRRNSVTEVGAWVRIRIDYTERGARAS